jgi:hypothetical protein
MAAKLKIVKRGDEVKKKSQMVSDKKILMGISHRVLC